MKINNNKIIYPIIIVILIITSCSKVDKENKVTYEVSDKEVVTYKVMWKGNSCRLTTITDGR